MSRYEHRNMSRGPGSSVILLLMSPPNRRRRGAAMRVILPQPHMIFRFTKPQEFDRLDDDEVCDSDPALSEESDACSETSPIKKQKPSKENSTQSHAVPNKEQGNSAKSSSGSARMSYFDCNLCFKSERQPVVTACGHLFCYSCLCDSLQVDRKCPVCEAEVVDGRIFPIYQCSGPRLKNVDKSV